MGRKKSEHKAKKWRPSPLRVKRLSDGRIFLNSLSAAKHYGLRIAHQIENCCNGFVRKVEGTEWEWVYSKEKIDSGNINDLKDRIKKAMEDSGIDWSEERNYYKKSGKARDPKFRQAAFPVVQFLRYWSKSEESREFIRTTELYELLQEWCIKNSYFLTLSTDRALSKHFKAWELLYRKLVGLIVDKRPFGKYGRKYACVRIDPSLVEIGISLYDEIPEYLPSGEHSMLMIKSGPRGIPIYCHNNGITYPSILIASKATLCYRQEIKSCCENDIEFVEGGNQLWKFDYGKWENVSVEWFLDKERYKYHSTTPIPIIDLITGETFESLAEASKTSGIPKDKIKDFCENGNKESYGLVANRFFADRERRWIFSYVVEEGDEW